MTRQAVHAPVLSTKNLALHFDGGRTRALDGVELAIAEGEFVAITGPSGCGKSSLLNLLGALDRPSTGELFFRGQPYSAIGELSLFRQQYLGFIFQAFHLIPTLSALDNVLVPTIGRKGLRSYYAQRAAILLEQMGLQERLGHLPAQLSGGERQRVAIARALINEPAIVLADEPTGSLDSANAAHVLDVIAGLRRERTLTLVMVTHDSDVSACADRIIRMRDGKIVSPVGGAA